MILQLFHCAVNGLARSVAGFRRIINYARDRSDGHTRQPGDILNGSHSDKAFQGKRLHGSSVAEIASYFKQAECCECRKADEKGEVLSADPFTGPSFP
jgi:hypothetical protein